MNEITVCAQGVKYTKSTKSWTYAVERYDEDKKTWVPETVQFLNKSDRDRHIAFDLEAMPNAKLRPVRVVTTIETVTETIPEKV